MRVALVVLLLVSRFALAAPTLEQARNEVAALKFAAATKTLAELEAQEGFTRAEVLEYLTLLGVVRGSMGDDVGAREAFTRALLVDPDWRLAGKLSPRISTPLLEARQRAKENGRLQLELISQQHVGSRWVLDYASSRDVLGLVTAFTFTITEDGVERTQTFAPSKATHLEVSGREVSVRWSLLGANRWVYAQGPVLVWTAPPEPVLAPTPIVVAPVTVTAPPPSTPPQRSKVPGAVVLGVGAAVAVAGGVFVGLSRADADATRQAQSVPEVQALIDRARMEQTVGFTLAGVGAAGIATGIVLLVTASSSSPSVALVPTPGGGVAVFSGSFP